MIDKTGFVVSFHGPGVEAGRIDVRDLAPALLSLGRLIDAANLAVFGEKQPIRLDAKAVSEGSFEILLEAVKPFWVTLTSYLDDKNVEQAKSLLEWLGILGIPSGIPSFGE